MSRVYASKIDISNFRTFGPNFSFSIPPEPSLIIVYGMNGLGKTTFFEAIEWLLTGDVRRITAALPPRSRLDKHLTRHNAKPNSHFVAATFAPHDTRVSRSVTQQPSMDELNQLLVSPDWTPSPENISTYLRLTMLLPQARKFRFEEESPKEQWQLLRGPAGVDQLDVMRKALGGLQTKNAFDKVVSELQTKLVVRQREIEDWKKLLDRQTVLGNRISTAQTVTPGQAESVISELRERLMTLEDSAAFSELKEADNLPVEIMLSMIAGMLDKKTDKIESELETLRGFSGLIDEWITIVNASESDATVFETLRKQVEETEKRAAKAEEIVDQCRKVLESAERQLTEIRKQKKKAEEVNEALARLEENRTSLDQLESELTNLYNSAVESRRKITEANKVDQERKSLAITLAGLVVENNNLTALSNRIVTFDFADDKFATAPTDLKTLQEEQQSLVKQAEEFESKIEEYRLVHEQLQQQKDVALADAEAMSRAIKIVCDHIEKDATKCPVCRAEYLGEKLKERAEQSVAEAGIDTEQIDRLIEQNQIKLEDHQGQLKSVKNRISVLPVTINEISRQLDVRQQESTAIESELASLGYEPTTSREQLRIASEATTKIIEETKDKTTGLPSAEDCRDQLDKLNTRLAEIELEEISTKIGIEELKTKIEYDEVTIQAFSEGIDDLVVDGDSVAQLLTDLRSTETTSTRRLQTAKQEHEQAEANCEKLASELQQLKTTQEIQAAALVANQQRQETLSARWQGVLVGTPDAISQQHAISQREDAIESMSSLRKECIQTAERLEAWRANNETTELASSISAKLQGHENCTEEELTAILEASIGDIQAEIERVKKVKERAAMLANDLQEKVDEFNDRALRPLKSRIQRFHDVLSPFRYQIDWEARTLRGSIELRQSVSRESGLDSQYASPQLELSDGQMAVQGLATLFAASTEYRWSRWPALLLDDPLQSSDLLHTSAFIDILRGLISELGYQIFLSSHDMEEAKYIIRKCERAGIKVSKCHLLGPRSNGVRAECT